MNDCGSSGSPLGFKRSTERVGLEDWEAYLVEVNEERADELRQRPEMADRRCHVFCEDNREFIPRIPQIIRAAGEDLKWATGCVLADPNGKTDLPIAQLEWLSQQCPRLDIVANFNCAVVKWHNVVFGQENPSLREFIQRMKKRHWLISDIEEHFQFCVVAGSGTPLEPSPALGIYNLATDRGQHWLQKGSETRKELAGRFQWTLPFDWKKKR